MSYHRITLNWVSRGRVQQNVFHVHNPDGALNATQIKDEVVANFVNVIRVHVGTQSSLQFLEVAEVGVASPPVPVQFPIGINGGGSASNMPLVCAEKLQFVGGLQGRRNRGRIYLPNISVGAFDGEDKMTSSEFTKINNTANTLQNRWASGGTGPLTLVIWHRSTNDATPVESVKGVTTIGVQRRRNVGVGI